MEHNAFVSNKMQNQTPLVFLFIVVKYFPLEERQALAEYFFRFCRSVAAHKLVFKGTKKDKRTNALNLLMLGIF